ncbi:MAG: hypothetical protein CMH64_02590 [Nanoarchaeota archaeon]|nr:hypothetical protein [Nanoarchaeota archaeon]|tara:strand:+ start:683 stop:1057 length:375 start_codon:yes stop_codon:yes gene_type:complete
MDHDASDVKQYCNKRFLTEQSRLGRGIFSVSSDGRFLGRASIEGAEIGLIAGLKPRHYHEVVRYLNPGKPELEELRDLINSEGKEISPGLHLVVALTDEAIEEREKRELVKRNGFVSAVIYEIE